MDVSTNRRLPYNTKFWRITGDSPKFSLLIRNMRELAWMALLQYIQLKSTRKQPLPDPNGELSPKSVILLPTPAGVGLGMSRFCQQNF